MYLTVTTKEQCETIRQWRNLDTSIYRTPFMLTPEMQEDFYKNVICNRKSEHRFLAVLKDKEFIGMIGLVDISLENRNAEISIVIDPKKRRKGYGKEALTLLLEYGFNQLNLDNIFGESYLLNPFLDFWYCMIETFNGSDAVLKNRKFYNGRYWDSLYFNFNRSDYFKL